MLPVIALVALSVSVVPIFAAPPPMPPQSVWETPEMKAAASLEASTQAAPKGFLTKAEETRWQETGSYDECVAFYRKLERATKFARLIPIGSSAEGRPLYAFVVSKDRAFTAEQAARTNKPIVLLQNGIHAGENGGKDAAMMLLRDVLVTRRLEAWLDNVIILSIPVFNVDGHERVSPYNRVNENGPAAMGFRATAQRINLNRDYLKADTPEMRAWLSLYTTWLPDFLIDNHVTDGSDHQYDVTIATHTEQDIAPEVGKWVDQRYVKRMLAEMERLGHITGWYAGFAGRGAQAIPVMTASPRYSTGYAAAQNRAALLVETHSLKTFRTRAWAHYDIMKITLDIVAEDAKMLKEASRAADRRMESVKPGDGVFLEGVPGKASEPYVQRRLEVETYEGVASGAPIARYVARPLNVETRLIRSLEPKINPEAPLGYIVPAAWSEVIERLRIHGVGMEPLPTGLDASFDTWRFDSVRFGPMPFEGRFMLQDFAARSVNERRVLPKGSMFVPVAQRAGKVAMHLLEPDAPDSAVRWGFFASIFEQKEYFGDYIFEPYAQRMLETDPKLKQEFEAALKRDPAMVKDGRARLTWLFRRSPYYEPDKDAYPVVRINKKTW